MECAEVRDRLASHVLGDFGDLRDEERAAVSAHLRECGECRETKRRLEKTAWILREGGAGPGPKAERRALVLAMVDRRNRRRILLGAAIPILIALALAAVYRFGGGPARVRRSILEAEGLAPYEGTWIPRGEVEYRAKGFIRWKGRWLSPEEVEADVIGSAGLVFVEGAWEPRQIRPKGEVYFRGTWTTEDAVARILRTERPQPFEPPAGKVYWDGAWIARDDAVRAAQAEAGVVPFHDLWISSAARERIEDKEVLARDGWTRIDEIEAKAFAREGLIREQGVWIRAEDRDALARGEIRTARGWVTPERFVAGELAKLGFERRGDRWVQRESNPVTALAASCRLGDPTVVGRVRVYPILSPNPSTDRSPTGTASYPIDPPAEKRPVFSAGAGAGLVRARAGAGRPVLVLGGDLIRDERGAWGTILADAKVPAGDAECTIPVDWIDAQGPPLAPILPALAMIPLWRRAAVFADGLPPGLVRGPIRSGSIPGERILDPILADPLAIGVAAALPGGAVAIDLFADHPLLGFSLERIVLSALGASASVEGPHPTDGAVRDLIREIETARFGSAPDGRIDFATPRVRGKALVDGTGEGARVLHLFAFGTCPAP
ncbi:MAG: zf-HC2 domain-containing protein [Planctomycetes bacterium]|nr:zf-HC2 domain-containing protein [Planctomycetota bacterium]